MKTKNTDSQTKPLFLKYLKLGFTLLAVLAYWYHARPVIQLAYITITPSVVIMPLLLLTIILIAEVYGYKHSRLALWLGLLVSLILLIYDQVYVIAKLTDPASLSSFEHRMLANIIYSVCGFYAGYIISGAVGAYTIAKIKIAWQGRKAALRFLLTMLTATLVYTVLERSIAMNAGADLYQLLDSIVRTWLFSIIIGLLGMPLNVLLAGFLKSREKLDIYDTDTRFNLFSLSTAYKSASNHYSAVE